MPHAGIVLSGGSDNEVEQQDWEDFFAGAERLTYNTMALPTDDVAIKELAVSFVKRMREDEGVKIQIVVANMEPDYEGIISVANGVVLSDGTTITPEQATAYVAGMTAGLPSTRAAPTIPMTARPLSERCCWQVRSSPS